MDVGLQTDVTLPANVEESEKTLDTDIVVLSILKPILLAFNFYF